MVLSKLLCGQGHKGRAKPTFGELSKSIDSFGNRSLVFLNTPGDEDTLNFGPFCARVLLENACAALVGRIDPFRVFYLNHFQTQPTYKRDKRAKSAFSWVGDVIAEEKPNQDMWSLELETSKLSRALFSQYTDDLFWKNAVDDMLDFLPTNSTDPSVVELKDLDSDEFISKIKGKSLMLYSTLSKAVHWEFFTSELTFDEVTTKNAIRDTCIIVGQLGLVSHFMPTAYGSIPRQKALNLYLSFREKL